MKNHTSFVCIKNNMSSMTEQLQKQQQYGYSLLYTFMRYHVFLH